MKYTILLVFALISLCCAEDDFPLVKTVLGKIKGQYKTTENGKKYAAFEGIRYARPPIGKLRFADPQPAIAWFGVWEATKLYTCAQFNTIPGAGPIGANGEEDCLYVNVYVPEGRSNEPLDVIVHIHGGAFMVGSGQMYVAPDYFMERNVILVTFNYRLGVFGFLSTGDKALPGNYGLKDQAMALKWIQHNIEPFGGNPNSVTITGISAGSASVHYHYVSPWSKGLFHRGTAQSGTILNPWAIIQRTETKTRQLANAVGCLTKNHDDLVTCLKSRPAALLLEKQNLLYDGPFMPLVLFGPVIDKHAMDPFIPEHPYELLSQGKLVNDVPIIFSTTADEGLPFTLIYLKAIENFDGLWPKLAPHLVDYSSIADKSSWDSVSQEIKQFYLGDDKPFSLETIKGFTNMFSDRFFLCGAETAARLHAKVSKSPVYYYSLEYEASVDLLKFFGIENLHSVPHGSDAQFLFTNKMAAELNLTVTLSDDDVQIRDFYLDVFTSFAKNGIPSAENLEWKPVTYDELNVLRIKNPNDVQVETVEELCPRSFWGKLHLLDNENNVQKDEL